MCQPLKGTGCIKMTHNPNLQEVHSLLGEDIGTSTTLIRFKKKLKGKKLHVKIIGYLVKRKPPTELLNKQV